MSHTDSTDPIPVVIWYAGRSAEHDHRHGACDLPRTLKDWLAGGSRCTWTWGSQPRTVCACGHQHGRQWLREDRRRNRKLVRVQLSWARHLANACGDLDDVMPAAYPRR